jgi:bifunctional UDP-N-acetylglucosamine pyrophosphorylase/glucosamine-1-phosphate N-acetyltransferase
MAEAQEGTEGATAPAGTADIAAVVLAAGKSTRMRSKTPKALHPVCGRPLLVHILNALAEAGVSRRVVIVGHQADAVRAALDAQFGVGTVEYAEQVEQKGTGHAAQMAEPLLAHHAGVVLIVPGDTPLLSGDILARLVAHHGERGAAATLLTTILPTDAGSYGRVLRDERGDVASVVEARDATAEQLDVREINTSVYAFSGAHLFRALRALRPNNAQGELYLTDVIGLMRSAGETIAALVSPDPDVVLGVNTRVELAEVSTKMRARLLRDLMLSGVTVIDPATTYVEAGVTVGQDTVLHPGTYLLGETAVGDDCVIGPNAHITDARLGDRVRARACFIEKAEVGDDCRIGPFAHLRSGTRLMAKVRVGNFVETKAATLHEGVAAGHLTYLGDAEIGARTNVGAGTITCNYDGQKKHRTVVGADTFIGSHSTLIAPITIGSEAFTAAGSVITQEVPDGALAIARERQSVKEGWWAARRRRGKETTEQQP